MLKNITDIMGWRCYKLFIFSHYLQHLIKKYLTIFFLSSLEEKNKIRIF